LVRWAEIVETGGGSLKFKRVGRKKSEDSGDIEALKKPEQRKWNRGEIRVQKMEKMDNGEGGKESGGFLIVKNS